MQNMVGMVQDYISSRPVGGNSGAPEGKKFNYMSGDRTMQFVNGRYGDFLQCQVCWWGVDTLHSIIANTLIQNIVEGSGILACSAFLSWSTCSGFVNQFADLIINNALKLNLQSNYFCTEVFDVCPSWNSNYIELEPTKYADEILSSKPDIVKNDDFIDNLYKEIAADPKREERPTLKFVHFTDIHMDLKYRAGASKKCSDVICCRASNGFPKDPALQAGPLGSFGCDIPIDVVTTMGDIINKEIKPDVVLWGGDVTPHDQNA